MKQICRPKQAVMIFVSVLVAGACYRQVPIDTANPAPSTRVIAHVTDSGVVAMGNLIGPSAQEIEGVVVETTPSTYKLSMLRVEQRGGISVDWSREEVVFPRSSLTRLTAKSLDKTRSWLLGGGITAGAILAAQLFKALGADEPGDEEPPPQTIILLPFRFR